MSARKTTRLRYLTDFNPTVPARVRSSESEFPLYSMETIHEFSEPSEPELRPIGDLLNGYSYIEPSDVAYAKVTPCFENRKGLVGSDLAGPSFATTEVTVLRPRVGVDDRYLAWLLQSGVFRGPAIASMTGAGGLRRVSESLMRDLALPAPVVQVQQAIADYLDHETAEIDALISDLFSAIGLAEERLESFRTGLLQSAGNACHRRLKTLADVTVGIVVRPSDWYAEAGVPALRGVNVKREFIALDDLVHITEAGHRLHPKSILKPGDVVVVRTGQAGAAAVVDASLTDCNAIDLLIIKRGTLLDPSFLAAFINSEPIRESVKSGTVGAIQGHFNVEALRNLEVPNLPLTKQVELVAAWHHERKLVSAMSADLTSAIALARERRAALITAAVTGQIDVTAKHRPAAEQLEDDIKELT